MNGNIQFSIYCGQQEFDAEELGDDLCAAVAHSILSRRQSDERYPCYITDLDLSRCVTASGAIQTITYLRHKYRLEQQLNSALQAL